MMSIKKDLDQFHPLSDSDQEILRHRKKQLLYLIGEQIFKQGAFAPYVIYIRSGLVRVYLQTGHRKKINISIAKSGEFLAFSSVFGEETYTYSAVALKDSEICMIDKEGLKQLLYNNNEVAMRITSGYYMHENHLLNIISSISHQQMRGKLATVLIYLTSKDFLSEEIFKYLTRQDLAEFASISTESAIKFLKEFEKEGIINLEGKDIQILEHDRLEIIARTG